MTEQEPAIAAFQTWYSKLRGLKRYGGLPAKGVVAAALVVLERLRANCELTISAHLAAGGAQIAGLSLASLRRVLERFGENRNFPSEGGRTNRGNNRPISQLLAKLNEAGLGGLAADERNQCIDEMQRLLVASLDGYYRLERLRFDYDPRLSARQLVHRILESASKRSQSGPVAQHLVGAKLAIRFPRLDVANFPYSAADEQAGRAGDFEISNSAFHVTVSPTLGHAERCKRNVDDGLGCYLLVPDSKVEYARVLVDSKGCTDFVAVESIESFVGQNLGEISEFAWNRFPQAFGELLREYNRRVEEVETDCSLFIEVPGSLPQS